MSSWATHMLIGGVGGLALMQAAPGIVPRGLVELAGGRPLVVELAVIGLSAVLATWPDIDEPGSWLSRRVAAVLTVLGFGLGCWLGLGGPYPGVSLTGPGLLVVSALAGTVVGALLAAVFLQGVRTAAGGHRRGTHSLVLAGVMGLAALGLRWFGLDMPAFVLLALVWGLCWHVVGDVVTPAGVPLLYPFSDRDVRLLPRPLARFGEPLIGLVTLAIGWVLVRW
ncbi:MAG TPA: metal-dependent hydrolase [Roseiflexaceae bacterium]|nr:metal-dependent hydrolase [Roseiflexaceae bacterium]